MDKPLSVDLWSLALVAVDEGVSCRAAARRFGVAAATVIRWYDQRRNTGGFAAKAQGGGTRLGRIEAHAHMTLASNAGRRNITVNELRGDLGKASVNVAISTLHRFSPVTRSRAKKTEHAVEQDRIDVRSQRKAWFDRQLDLDPARLVFIDET